MVFELWVATLGGSWPTLMGSFRVVKNYLKYSCAQAQLWRGRMSVMFNIEAFGEDSRLRQAVIKANVWLSVVNPNDISSSSWGWGGLTILQRLRAVAKITSRWPRNGRTIMNDWMRRVRPRHFAFTLWTLLKELTVKPLPSNSRLRTKETTMEQNRSYICGFWITRQKIRPAGFQ
jgi:hypothetical protein